MSALTALHVRAHCLLCSGATFLLVDTLANITSITHVLFDEQGMMREIAGIHTLFRRNGASPGTFSALSMRQIQCYKSLVVGS